MTDTLDLFGHQVQPIAPFSNATTSKEAAQVIVSALPRLEGMVLTFLRERGVRGAANHEIQEMLGLSGDTVRPRVVSLVRKGMVYDSEQRRATASGRDAIVWRAR